MTPRVVVVGLGPGDVDMMTTASLDEIASASALYMRTERHPAASSFPEAISFDHVYEHADMTEDVYTEIVEQLVQSAATEPHLVYAVPGSPLVAERTVQLLLADNRIEVEVVPALSFLDLAWVRLGIDPIAEGVKVVDGHEFSATAAGVTGAMLVCQCDSPMVLGDIKLSIEDWPEEPITVIQRLGLPDEAIFEVSWEDLDRTVNTDHLTTIYIPTYGIAVAAEVARFDELVHALRAGCPWDRKQTNGSLKRYLLEECYELLEAIDNFDIDSGDGADDLCEELGDVLFQVFFHSTIAAEFGWFTLADVARGVHDKLYTRHPHVFGGPQVSSEEELSVRWEAAKQIEKSRDSVMDGIPAELPALLSALKHLKKAGTRGYVEPLPEAVESLHGSEDLTAEQLGDLLLGVSQLAHQANLDPEDALRLSSRRFRARSERPQWSLANKFHERLGDRLRELVASRNGEVRSVIEPPLTIDFRSAEFMGADRW